MPAHVWGLQKLANGSTRRQLAEEDERQKKRKISGRCFLHPRNTHRSDVHAAYIWPKCTVCVMIEMYVQGTFDSNVRLQYISGMYA